jgi:hypothetical protein
VISVIVFITAITAGQGVSLYQIYFVGEYTHTAPADSTPRVTLGLRVGHFWPDCHPVDKVVDKLL